MTKEGIEFRTNVEVGKDLDSTNFFYEYDAILVATGASQPRDLNIPSTEIIKISFRIFLKLCLIFILKRSKFKQYSFCDKFPSKLATQHQIAKRYQFK